MTPSPPDPDRPALRPLELVPARQDGQRGLMLVDRMGIAAEVAFVPEGLLPVLARFDGSATVAEIHAGLEEQTGRTLPGTFVGDIVRQLDERLLLDSPGFRRRLREAVEAFGALEVRPARHAGSVGYPDDPAALEETLAAMVGTRPPLRPAPRGLVAPHIDIVRGREGYAQAYGWLAESEPADLYVVFGTGHQGPAAPVTGLAMDWQTPLGRVATDRGFVAAVHGALGGPDPEDVFLHRDEHSIEFQVLFLQQVLGDRPFEVACFLTGALPSADGDPDREDHVGRTVAAFEAAAAASGKRVCWIAGADLAHLGPHFGDPEPVDRARLDELDRIERRRLAHLLGGDPGRFHADVLRGGNPERVCGTTPIYLTARLAGGPGELLHYGQAPADDGSQVVSFCSVGFGEPM